MGKRKAANGENAETKETCTEKNIEGFIGIKQRPNTNEEEKTITEKNIESYEAIKQRQKAAMQRPKVFLTASQSEQPASGATGATAPKLYVRDLQYLLVYAMRKGLNYEQPKWCHLLRPSKMAAAVVIVLNDVSLSDFQHNTDCFPFIQETFNEKLRTAVTNPSSYFSSFHFEMYAVPMSASQLRGYKKNHVSTHKNGVPVVFPVSSSGIGKTKAPEAAAAQPSQAPVIGLKSEETALEAAQRAIGQAHSPICCRTQLLLSVAQMVAERYPLPHHQDIDGKYADFVMTKETYAPVSEQSPLFAVDCEMVLTSILQHELTRVSVTNEQNEVIYDELVKPYNPIINYLTRYSGMTKKLLDPVTKRIEDVQREISELIPADAILCGQSLGNDLTALKMFHPYVIDTSVIYNMSGCRRIKCGLKRLSYCFLGRVIQESTGGHSSAEDAIATMDLVKLKLQKPLEFGDAVLGASMAPYLPSYPEQIGGAPAHTHYLRHGVGHKEPAWKSKKEKPQVPDAWMRSLFDIFNEQGVAACQIGGEKLVSYFQEEAGVKCWQAANDQEVCAKAQEVVGDYGFTWMEFSAFSEVLATLQDQQAPSPDTQLADHKQKRKALKFLDKQVKQVMEQFPEKYLVTLVLTGRVSKQQVEQAAAFLHIT